VSAETKIQTRWLVEGHLILVVAPPVLTTEALRENDALIRSMLDASDAPLIHVLLDTRAVKQYPPFREAKNMEALSHPRLGWSLTVGTFQNPALRFFISAVRSIRSLRQRDFTSISEALMFLRSIDPAITVQNVDV
jgi:hypothetical protein